MPKRIAAIFTTLNGHDFGLQSPGHLNSVLTGSTGSQQERQRKAFSQHIPVIVRFAALFADRAEPAGGSV